MNLQTFDGRSRYRLSTSSNCVLSFLGTVTSNQLSKGIDIRGRPCGAPVRYFGIQTIIYLYTENSGLQLNELYIVINWELRAVVRFSRLGLFVQYFQFCFCRAP